MLDKLCYPLLLICLLTTGLQGQEAVSFAGWKWTAVEKSEVKTVNHLGQEGLWLKGVLWLNDTMMRDGSITVDIVGTGERCFAGVSFRAVNPENSEDFYLRLHKSDQVDAVQYAPVYQGESNWQLYSDYQAQAHLPTDRWSRLRLDFKDQRLAVYLNDDAKPLLLIDDLKLAATAGGMGLYSSAGAYFANFQWRREQISLPTGPGVVSTPIPNAITSWKLSPVFSTSEMAEAAYPGEEKLKGLTWRTATTEASGLLPISKYRPQPSAVKEDELVLARLIIHTDRAQTKPLQIDYSDRLHLFLNGAPLFAGNNGFRFKGLTFRGDLHPGGNVVYLPLRAGRNELLCIVTEQANGWALWGVLPDRDGIRLD